MPEIIFTGRVSHGGSNYGPGDRLTGKDANLRPIVDCGSARWADDEPETEGWDLKTPPAAYLERYPDGPSAPLARQILGVEEGE